MEVREIIAVRQATSAVAQLVEHAQCSAIVRSLVRILFKPGVFTGGGLGFLVKTSSILERSEIELSTLVFLLVRSGERRTQTLQITKIGRSQPQGLPPANNTSGKNTWIFWTLILSKLCERFQLRY